MVHGYANPFWTSWSSFDKKKTKKRWVKIDSEADLHTCCFKEVFWKCAANLQENTYAEVWLPVEDCFCRFLLSRSFLDPTIMFLQQWMEFMKIPSVFTARKYSNLIQAFWSLSSQICPDYQSFCCFWSASLMLLIVM